MDESIVVSVCIICLFFGVGMGAFFGSQNGASCSYTNSIQDLKVDAYTAGFIDGRGSILEEQSTWNYTSIKLGVPESNVPNPSPQWREYANKIAEVKEEKE